MRKGRKQPTTQTTTKRKRGQLTTKNNMKRGR
jgi:hypothetical protein